jgi:hypothetical protein
MLFYIDVYCIMLDSVDDDICRRCEKSRGCFFFSFLLEEKRVMSYSVVALDKKTCRKEEEK